MKLKGKAKPVTVYTIDGRVPASAWLREAAVGPLVGRDEELASLESALDALEGKQGRVLTLSGDTGMGKTRLIAELARRARYWGVELLAGRCLSYAQATPYTPWIESLWRWFDLTTAADKTERRARVYQSLGSLGLGELNETICELLGLPQDGTSPTPKPSHPTPPKPSSLQGPFDLYAVLKERIAQVSPTPENLHLTLAWRLAERYPELAADIPSLWDHLGRTIRPDQALLTLFKEVAQQNRPVFFIVEDLQWADQASWTALVNLAEATVHYPIFLLVTMRSGKSEERWLTEISESAQTEYWTLTGLSWDDTRKLALQLIRAREVAPELVSWLHQRAQGNPLFISQLLKLASIDGLDMDEETGRVTLSKTLPSIPLSVREIMLSQVDRLSEETRTVVKLASVIGDNVPLELLTRLWLRAGIADEIRLVKHLADLAARSLLTPEPPATEFTFVHPLLREAVYSSVPYAQRRQWHRAIADGLAEGEPETVHQHLEELAYHYKHGDDPKLGVRYNLLAGDKARTRQAWNEAREYYREGIDIAGQDPLLGQERSLAYESLGDVYALTERYAEAVAAYEGAQAGTPYPARLEGKLGLICPLVEFVDEAIQHMEKSWDELDLDVPLRPWLAAALGWVALRARPTDMASVARAGAAAITWFQRGRRAADSETAQVALKEMMAGRVPADYGHLVRLALNDRDGGQR
jgi:predicted ATPase